jgi:hypothetical protein
LFVEILKSRPDQDSFPLAGGALTECGTLGRPRRQLNMVERRLIEMPFNMITYFRSTCSLDNA